MDTEKACAINCVAMFLLSLPCALGFNVLSGIQPLGEGTGFLDLEDFIVSNLLLPIGSLIFLLFWVTKWCWGFDKYQEESNTGEGVKLPDWLKVYYRFILPVLILVILIQGLLP